MHAVLQPAPAPRTGRLTRDFRVGRGESTVARSEMSDENRAIYDAAQREFYAQFGLPPPHDVARRTRRVPPSATKLAIAAYLRQHVGEVVSGRDVSVACGLPTGNGHASHWLNVLAREGLVRRVHRTAWLIVESPNA